MTSSQILTTNRVQDEKNYEAGVSPLLGNVDKSDNDSDIDYMQARIDTENFLGIDDH